MPTTLRAPDSFLRALLAARDMHEFARLVVQHLEGLGCHRIQFAWHADPGQEQAAQTWPHGTLDPATTRLLAGARRPGEIREATAADGESFDCACLLADSGQQWAALVYRRDRSTLGGPRQHAEWHEMIGLLSLRCDSLLQTERLRNDVERLARAERLQRALFAISDCASSDRDTADVLHELHQIVGRLMYARNFYIVRYNAEPETMQFIYFADSLDLNRRDPDEVVDAAALGNSLTLAMVRRGLPLHGPGDLLREQLRLPRSERIGPGSEDWLGVPMVENGQVRGAVVVQSYEPAIRYSYDDQTLLAYLAQNIMTTLSRREAAEEMERRVAERTLALREEIVERQRAERLQASLFRIAEIAGGAGSMESFYATLHGIVNELLDARNFYIGIVSDDGTELHFPFSVDDHHERFESRKLGRGLSEYVLRTARPQLVDYPKFEELKAAGEVEWIGIAAACWLGVPLVIDDRSFGVIAVQSYTPDYQYSLRDKELLSFVSMHIANALERRRNSESLRLANLQLEHASQTDPLTGLHNRRYLACQVPIDLAFYEREQQRSGDGEQRLVFAVVDIDHFKRINDTYGHSAGDRALQVFADVLTGLVQTGDYVVRWGGEEFLLVFRPMQRQAVAALGERIRRRVAQHLYDAGEGLRLPMTCSIGLAEYPIFPDAPKELGWEQAVELADAALYWVKNNGRNGWAILRPGGEANPGELVQSLRAGSQALLDSPQLKIVASRAFVKAD